MFSEQTLITALWVCFTVYWLVAARGAKRTVSSGTGPSTVLRSVLAVTVVAVVTERSVRLPTIHEPAALSASLGVVGVALCVIGIAFAIWARTHIGRNWGMPGSVKADAELVTTGPYALVRHPIYTGVLLAMLGSALAQGNPWTILLAAFSAYFLYNARVEERTMAREFPDEDGRYRARTKMLVPYLV